MQSTYTQSLCGVALKPLYKNVPRGTFSETDRKEKAMGRKKTKKPQSGLDDLFSENFFYDEQPDDEAETSETGGGGVTNVRISLVEPNPEQPRRNFDDDSLSALADSIRQYGLIQPLLVRPIGNGGYQIVAGERRWRAARLADLNEVPVVIRELDDLQTAQVALVENLVREDLDPIEEAEGYERLINTFGMTQLEVAKAVGKSRSGIANSLRILNLCDDVKKLVTNKEISFGHAKVIAGLEDIAHQKTAALKVTEEGLSVRELEEYIQKGLKPKKQRLYPLSEITKEMKYSETEKSLKEAFGCDAKIKWNKKGKTSLTLICKSEDDFSELMKKLTEITDG